MTAVPLTPRWLRAWNPVLLGLVALLLAGEAALGAPGVALLAAGYGALVALAFAPVARGMLVHVRRIVRFRDARLNELAAIARDELVEQATHGDVASDMRRVLGIATARGGAVAAQAERLLDFEEEILATLDQQRALRARGGLRAIEATAPLAPREDGFPMTWYGTMEHPDWLPSRLGIALEQVGMVLDEVRVLHTAQVEWSVLLVTLWTRALLLALAPLLGVLTFAPVPLAGGFGTVDLPWVLATAASVVTALEAPRIADGVMDRGAAGARLRRTLLRVEVPIAVVLCVTAPAWFVCVFVSGWTNWWQRPTFDWLRLAAFLVVVAALQGAGLVAAGVPIALAGVEILLTFAAIGVTGGSYGAMLPVSASMLLQALVGAPSRRYRAVRAAREDLLIAADGLDAIADGLVHGEPADPISDVVHAADDARRASRRLRLAASRLERNGGVPPRGLQQLVGAALSREEVPGHLSDEATRRRLQALERGEEEPLIALDVAWRPEGLATARVARRAHRRALADVMVVLVAEAKRHGCGPLSVELAIGRERLELVVANVPSAARTAGRGTGHAKVRQLSERLPGGACTFAEPVDGARFGRGGEWLFVATVSCAASVLRSRVEDPELRHGW